MWSDIDFPEIWCPRLQLKQPSAGTVRWRFHARIWQNAVSNVWKRYRFHRRLPLAYRHWDGTHLILQLLISAWWHRYVLTQNDQCNFCVAIASIASIFYRWKIKKHIENHTSLQKLAKKLEMGTWWENIDQVTLGNLGHGDLSISGVNSRGPNFLKIYSSWLVLFNWLAQIQSGLSMRRDRNKKNKPLQRVGTMHRSNSSNSFRTESCTQLPLNSSALHQLRHEFCNRIKHAQSVMYFSL